MRRLRIAAEPGLEYSIHMHPAFKYENSDIASITAVKLSGKPAVGGAVLVVRLEIMMQPKRHDPPPRMVVVAGKILRGADVNLNALASVAALTSALGDWECVDFGQANTIFLEAHLSPAQVRAFDEGRDGTGNASVVLTLDAAVHGRAGQLPTSVTYPLQITASDWARILSEMKFEDRATFEVPVAGGRVGPPLDKAAAHLQTALDRVQLRQWPDALKACREVLDELQQFQSQATPPWADWADKPKREAWGVAERLVATQAAVRHMTHAGAHASIGNADENAVRLAVTMTGALLRYYAAR